MADAFKNQINTILGNVTSMLTKPLLTYANTEFSLYIASAANSTGG
jgi:hypothetical protein